MNEQQNIPDKNTKFKKWIKKIGWGGIAFFTIKGFAWLIAFYYGVDLLKSCSQNKLKTVEDNLKFKTNATIENGRRKFEERKNQIIHDIVSSIINAE